MGLRYNLTTVYVEHSRKQSYAINNYKVIMNIYLQDNFLKLTVLMLFQLYEMVLVAWSQVPGKSCVSQSSDQNENNALWKTVLYDQKGTLLINTLMSKIYMKQLNKTIQK